MLLFWAKVEKKRQLTVLIFHFVVSLLSIIKKKKHEYREIRDRRAHHRDVEDRV